MLHFILKVPVSVSLYHIYINGDNYTNFVRFAKSIPDRSAGLVVWFVDRYRDLHRFFGGGSYGIALCVLRAVESILVFALVIVSL